MEFNEDEFEFLFLDGWNLTPKEIQKLENELSNIPDKIAIRIKILGHFRKQLLDTGADEYEQKYLQHLAYLISTIPYSTILSSPLIELHPELDFDQRIFNRLKPIWQKQLEENSNDYNLFMNSGTFFLPFQNQLAEKLFLQANALKPNDLQAICNIAQVYNLNHGDMSNQANAVNIINLLERLARESKSCDGISCKDEINQFISLLEAALENGIIDKFPHYTKALNGLYQQYLMNEPQDSDLIHDVNILLGNIEFESYTRAYIFIKINKI